MKRRYEWAELLRRVLAVDVLRCGLCGGRRELIAQISQPGAVMAILSALGLSTEALRVHPARGPPRGGRALLWAGRSGPSAAGTRR